MRTRSGLTNTHLFLRLLLLALQDGLLRRSQGQYDRSAVHALDLSITGEFLQVTARRCFADRKALANFRDADPLTAEQELLYLILAFQAGKKGIHSKRS